MAAARRFRTELAVVCTFLQVDPPVRSLVKMGLKLFNTLSRSIEEFVPLDPNGREAGLYCCGPTVYDFGHIGNFRTFVFADLLRRYLGFKG